LSHGHNALDRRLDCTGFSFEFGLAKPDPEVHLEATRRLRVDVADTGFIGDGMDEEVSGAERAGLRAFRALWFLRCWTNFREEPGSTAIATVEDVFSLVEQSTESHASALPQARSAQVPAPRR